MAGAAMIDNAARAVRNPLLNGKQFPQSQCASLVGSMKAEIAVVAHGSCKHLEPIILVWKYVTGDPCGTGRPVFSASALSRHRGRGATKAVPRTRSNRWLWRDRLGPGLTAGPRW